MMQRLAVLDMGIAVLSEEVVTEDLTKGRLRRVLPDWGSDIGLRLCVTETRLLRAKTQRFIKFGLTAH